MEYGDVRRLRGRGGELRLRVGAWRIRFLRDEATRPLVILHVLPRAGGPTRTEERRGAEGSAWCWAHGYAAALCVGLGWMAAGGRP
ncbi:MAG: hypothetical protein HY689_06915 [Chloroflexi bacterium]|nr:hypothetical protein [Chloroflexota bacterium]